MNNALKKSVDRILDLAINEDQTKLDLTSSLTLTNKKIKADIVFKEKGILSGTDIINHLIKKYNNKIFIKWRHKDGDKIKKFEKVGTVYGPAKDIISLERIILNFLQRLCGISTLTEKYSKIVKKTQIKILDTRKNIPGWRLLEKYAVRIGGGLNHRTNLKDQILVKENHIFLNNNIEKTLEKLKKNKKIKVSEIEVTNMRELKVAIKFRPKRIMLDNFSIANIKKSVQLIRNSIKSEIEVSGKMTINKIEKIKKLDIDFISVGKITHSACFLDISMLVVK
ncbi:carboxylating nicotinate-nucleotide diphosphorylase [bacterium]|nr:carboxylating nicotinate-nucleotide diphosphorylase [bacterium]|tara:strand:- start:1484 stop:2326 length:843 start_codon:yes stop_codon:yes gene_type:complete